MPEGEGEAEGSSSGGAAASDPKDPRTIARKYQLDLCKRAVEENVIVYLGTGCGKTHIAVLLMYELGHLIRKPSREVCVFLAPTIPLVRQQAMVIADSTNFKVQRYYGSSKNSRDHQAWEKEMAEYEVLVMTPQILLQNLRHCFIKMNSIALLIFDECHHAQAPKRHPYAQIMKEFYNNVDKPPRVFGMTASPIIGKGGSNKLIYTKCINSLEELLNAKVCSVDNVELESVVASPEIEVYSYGPVGHSNLTSTYCKELDGYKLQSECMLRESLCNFKESQKKLKSLWRLHENLIFCLHEVGLFGALQAARIFLSPSVGTLDRNGIDINDNHATFVRHYLEKAISLLSCDILDGADADSIDLETLEEPFFSKKFAVLIDVLSRYRLEENMKCIVFVKRIIVARVVAHILQNLKCLDFWKCEFLVGCHSGLKNMSRNKMGSIIEKFSSGEVNLLIATSVGEEGLDIQTCCLVVRFDLPETVSSFIQSRGRARMSKSKYVFLLERGNQAQEKLLDDYITGENIMDKEINLRTSNDMFDCLEENTYRVNDTGASISTACSVSLLHRYCDNLPRDMFFTPSPAFFFVDDVEGIICRLILPPNAAFRQVNGQPRPSKDEAKRDACLKACIKLHELGALTDFLLPGQGSRKIKVSTTNISESNKAEDESFREELHEMLVPAVLRPSRCKLDSLLDLHFYYIEFIPKPADRRYQMFGLFVIYPLPKEAEKLDVELHLARARIVKAGMKYLGMIAFNKDEMILAHNFQEMFLKVLLDRSEFTSSYVMLGNGNDAALQMDSTFYLLLPIKQKFYGDKFMIDWPAVKRCLSSPVFQDPTVLSLHDSYLPNESLKLLDGTYSKADVIGSLVFTPHNQLFFFIDVILDEINAKSEFNGATYVEHFKERFDIELSHPEQPLLKAKQLFSLRNLLHNRQQESTESVGRDLMEHFVELPPELCSLKITGFSKDMGSSLSLLPSLMCRLENLLVAIELKDVMVSYFPEASQISALGILEALTTERCLERISLERLEVLGDAFLKYVVGRHNFISYEGLDEGQLTRRRSDIVNNSNLYELSIKRNLQVYIRDQQFEPTQFFALGRPCKVVCSPDNEESIHQKNIEPDRRENCNLRCTKSHHWLHRKTIADVVESLLGAFIVECGFKAAFAFLNWMGIKVDFKDSSLYRILDASSANLSLMNYINITELEELIGYQFKCKGLLIQAFVHPSFNKHSGGCYQRMEFLGDAVLEYLMTSYLYSAYPDLKPGQITDLKSLAVNNNSFAYVAVKKSILKYIIKDSNYLTAAVNKYENYINLSNSEKDLVEEPACPKVLGDIVESCVGAVLLDSGFNLNLVWKLMLMLLKPILSFRDMHINPMREIRELCQYNGFELGLPKPKKADGEFHVKVEVNIDGNMISCTAANRNSKDARKLAAQEMLSKLKNYGYRHKSKSLEEILRATTKKESKLIGYDEEPIRVEDDISLEMKNLQLIGEMEGNIFFQNKEVPFIGRSETSIQSTRGDSKVEKNNANNGGNNKSNAVVQNGCLPTGATDEIIKKEYHGDMVNKTARSFLYELCAANYWKPPEFELCKDEGPSHLRKFTCKVLVPLHNIFYW
ncbi:hypothetical protein BS78_06G155400 [Paspalum vaginatum]|nr:hypothetical protein BS78_06G155400 [Paspalum vaginatum]